MARKRSETLHQCFVSIKAANANQSVRVERLRGGGAYRDSTAVITLEGDLKEPLKGRTQVSLMVFLSETRIQMKPEHPSIGAITSMRDTIQAGIFVTEGEFNRIWTLVANESIRECVLVTTEPHYGSARLVNVSFRTELSDA